MEAALVERVSRLVGITNNIELSDGVRQIAGKAIRVQEILYCCENCTISIAENIRDVRPALRTVGWVWMQNDIFAYERDHNLVLFVVEKSDHIFAFRQCPICKSHDPGLRYQVVGITFAS